MSTSHITEHFAWAEAACHSGAEVPIELQPNARHLAALLELIRARFGCPIVPVSWYRDPEYNHRIHGAPKSQHMMALAADVRPMDLADLPRLRAVIETMLHQGEALSLGGFGVYPGWLHLDARQRVAPGYVVRWFGRGVGSET